MSSLPLPPRTVRATAIQPVWRDFGIIATAAVLAGGIACAAVCIADGRTPRGDWRLDAARATANGTITATEPRALGAVRCEYQFVASDGATHSGHAWLDRAPLPQGAAVPIEYLPTEPAISRLEGAHHALLTLHWDWVAPLLLSTVLALGLTLARRYQIYVALRHGRAATAQLTSVQALPLRPGRLRVTCRFRDSFGKERSHRLHVAAASELGRAALATKPGEPIAGAMVVHQESNPKQCRLVHGSDLAQADA